MVFMVDVPFKSGCYSVSQKKWDENEFPNGTFLNVRSVMCDLGIFVVGDEM